MYRGKALKLREVRERFRTAGGILVEIQRKPGRSVGRGEEIEYLRS